MLLLLLVTVGRSRPVVMAMTVRRRGGLPVLLRCRRDGGGRGLDLQVVREGALLLGLRGGGRCGLHDLVIHHPNIVSRRRMYSFGCCWCLLYARLRQRKTRDACARKAWPSSASSLTPTRAAACDCSCARRPTKTLFYPLNSARPCLSTRCTTMTEPTQVLESPAPNHKKKKNRPRSPMRARPPLTPPASGRARRLALPFSRLKLISLERGARALSPQGVQSVFDCVSRL